LKVSALMPPVRVSLSPCRRRSCRRRSRRRLLAACRSHAHTAAERCDACLAWLAAAAELYRGDFLAGFGLPDGAPFEEWAAIQREQLRQQVLDALDTLSIGHELRGDYAANGTTRAGRSP
jgi:hypothetical protein